MKQHVGLFQVEKMAKTMEVSVSGYYRHSQSKSSKTAEENAKILDEIKSIYKASRGTYGSPRICAELRDNGKTCSRKRVAKIMKGNGIVAKMRKRFKVTTKRSSTPAIVAPNHLEQNFTVSSPNVAWVGDITYIYTSAGWLYLAIVLDLFSRKIVGAAMSDRLQTDVVLKAVNQALRHRKPNGELIHHSDRGCQYTSYDFRELAKNEGIKLSMSGCGNCYDNAVAESFFHTLKTEHIQFNHFKTREEAVNSIFEYIEIFYNRQRRHSTLNYLSPMEFEKRWFMQQVVSFPGVH